MRVDLETFGEKQFSREILRVGKNAMNMRGAFDDVHDLVLEVEERQFASQGGAYSGGWKPLAPSTVKYKAANNLDPRILHATLRLRKSLTAKTHPDHVFRSSNDEMFIGSRVPYGPYHQQGRGVPQRRPFQFDRVVREGIVKILQRHLVEGGAFGGRGMR